MDCVCKDIDKLSEKCIEKKFKVAVTSKQGRLVDLHFGHATEFLVYEIGESEIKFIEVRSSEEHCKETLKQDGEHSHLDLIIDVISDCDAVLTMKIGNHAEKKLKEKGIESIEYWYTIEKGLNLVKLRLI